MVDHLHMWTREGLVYISNSMTCALCLDFPLDSMS